MLGVRIGCLVRGCGNGVGTVSGGTGVDLNGCTSEVDVLIKSLPSQVGALRVEVGVSELPLVRPLFLSSPALVKLISVD